MFKKILVPVDGSEPSYAGVQLAVRMAVENGAEIIFAHVVDLTQSYSTWYPYGGVGIDLRSAETTRKGLLADAAAIAGVAGVPCTTALLEGRRLDTLLDQIEKYRIDLVVIGSHGRGGLLRALLGSTAEGVLREASVPVLVATHKPVVAAVA